MFSVKTRRMCCRRTRAKSNSIPGMEEGSDNEDRSVLRAVLFEGDWCELVREFLDEDGVTPMVAIREHGTEADGFEIEVARSRVQFHDPPAEDQAESGSAGGSPRRSPRRRGL